MIRHDIVLECSHLQYNLKFFNLQGLAVHFDLTQIALITDH